MSDIICQEAGAETSIEKLNDDDQKRKEDKQQEYRLYNFLQFFDLTMYIVNNSKYPPMIFQSQADINEIKWEIATLKQVDADLREHIDKCNDTLVERIENNENIHSKFTKEYKIGFEMTQDRIQKTEDAIAQAQKILRNHSYELKN